MTGPVARSDRLCFDDVRMRIGGSRLQRLVTAPALHFLVIGATLLAGDHWLRAGVVVASDAGARTITITAADRERLRQDCGDRVVRTRLAQLASFVGESGGEEELVHDARRLGLDKSDLVVRRYLVQTMRLIAGRPGRGDTVTEADLAAWFEAHRDQYRQPARIDLTHVYLSRDRRRATLAADAAALLARLRAGRVPPGRAKGLGDPFIRGCELTANSPGDLDRTFGPGFADAVAGLPVGVWSGPIPSAYGLHLVWVRRRAPATTPPLAAVRNQVVQALLEERRQARIRKRLDEWRRRYVVVVEGGNA
jgi:peptidyl-prolyl cis-trans isomerase C